MTPDTTTSVPFQPKVETVLVVGDSLARGIFPPVAAALAGPGTKVEWEWVIGVMWPEITPTWEHIFAATQPDLLIVQLGTWENFLLREGTVIDPTDPDWKSIYRREVADPWIAMAEESDSSVVWMAMPKSSEPIRSADYRELDAVWRDAIQDAAATHQANGTSPTITWQDDTNLLTGPDGEFLAIDESVDPPIRLFNIDGLHWCAGGAQRVTQPLLEHLLESFDLQMNPGWPNSGWDQDLEAYPDGECPNP